MNGKLVDMKDRQVWLEDKNEELLEENETVRQDKGQRNESLPATTKEKNQYSPVIRKLCYEVLALKISPSVIPTIVKAVISRMVPVTTLQLPSRSTIEYMRKEEMTTHSKNRIVILTSGLLFEFQHITCMDTKWSRMLPLPTSTWFHLLKHIRL